ncbi:MAG: hypothetical protein E7552_06335 [Ruminococcaceae bacterium]|nr:hypothetical protein [Oscillospiraceae bacterium]
MKRVIALISVLILLMGSTACAKKASDAPSGGKTPEKANGTTAQNESGATTPQGDPVIVTNENGVTVTAPQGGTNGTTTAGGAGSASQGTTAKPATQTATGEGDAFKGLTVLDNAKCRIHVTDVDPNGASGYVMHVSLENRSTKAAYYFSVDEATVNGVAVGPLMAVEVAAGQKVEESILLSNILPKGVDIGEYTDILLNFSVSDANDWAAPPIAQAIGRVYPKGADKASVYRRTPQEGDRVLLDTDAMTVIAVNTAENAAMHYYYSDVYFVNKTKDAVMLSLEGTTINGVEIEPRFGTLLEGGCSTFGKIVWLNNTLAGSHIDKVEEIRFTLCAYARSVLESVTDDTEEPPHVLKETLTYKP